MRRLLPAWTLGAVLLTVAAGSAPAAAAASAGPAALASSARTAVEICGQGPARVRPSHAILTCADDGELATHLRWASWTRTRAAAAGTVTWRTGSPAIPASIRWHAAKARFALTEPAVERNGKVLFTKLSMHATGTVPAGFMRNVTWSEAPVPATLPAGGAPRSRPVSPAAPAASSGTLSYARIEGFWIDAGGAFGSGQAQTAAAIAGAESSDYPGVIQAEQPYSTTGWGLWQITPGNSVSTYGQDFQLLDPWNNAEAAVSKYNSAGGFTPWTTYTDGAYTSFLQNVNAYELLSDPGEYYPVNSAPSGTHNSSSPGSTSGPAMRYNILNYHTAYCLDANSNSFPSNGDGLQLWGCNNNGEQEWYYNSSTDQIINSSGQCLDANSNSFPSNGDSLQLWGCNNHAEEEWVANAVSVGGSTHYQLENAADTGYCIDANSNNYYNDGDALQLWSCNTNDEQLWP
jgi:hypothetical protein